MIRCFCNYAKVDLIDQLDTFTGVSVQLGLDSGGLVQPIRLNFFSWPARPVNPFLIRWFYSD